MKRLKVFIGGKWIESKTDQFMDVYDPSIGDVMAQTPCCTIGEVNQAIGAARDAFEAWSKTPVMKRVQVLYKLRSLLEENMDELTRLVAMENGKSWEDAMGDVVKAKEGTEVACNMPTMMMGESLWNTSTGYDTVLTREPVGVFAGIVPFNFPAMIPMGWMTPMCIAAGNTIVIKAASMTPMTCMRIAELYQEAGLPDGVINIVTCSRKEADLLMEHKDIRGISFVGSTSIGMHIYGKAAANGKRVQALCEAKNHALVLEDAPIERTARGIINSAFGCAGERCMALPAVVVQESVADRLVETLVKFSKERKLGRAYDKDTEMGPLVSPGHKRFVEDWIQKGVDEGAKLVLDGRNPALPDECKKGFFVGATIFDHVTADMTIGDEEVFGPVLCVKRVKTFEEGLAIMNNNRFANGSVIYTQNGYYSREFTFRTHGGMVGINVGIPVPVGVFPFSGHKNSFFGDLHCLGKDGMRFYTQTKSVTTHWFDEEDRNAEKISSWDGTI